jgi:Fic family protein
MNRNEFGTASPGRLIAIDEVEQAFVPHPLPPEMPFPTELWPFLMAAREKIALLEGVGRGLPDPALLLKPLSSREALQSSALEGTFATPRQLLLFEREHADSESDDQQVNEQREVFNYGKALEHGVNSELPLSLRLIREMHGILLSAVRGANKAPGKFRKIQVFIGSNHRFIPPPPQLLDECLGAFEKYLHAPPRFDPLVECFLTHYQFETIHPFIDGNGRVGRLLLALMIRDRCRLSKPWLFLSEYYERFKDEYCVRLFDVSTRGAWREWIEFCLRGVIDQCDSTLRRCERLQRIREDYLERLGTMKGSLRLHGIVQNLFRSPYVQIPDVVESAQVTFPTAKADLERLVKAKILRQLQSATQITYVAPEIYDAAYGDIEELTD